MTDTDVVSRVPSDADLISATRAGDDQAYAELYRRHGGAAEAAARSLTRSKNDADDLVAEAFTRLLVTIRNGGGPQVAFRPYLLTAVRNVFYDRTRKDKRLDVTAEVPEEVDLSALTSATSDEDRAMIAAAFASLPERWQMVLWHTEVEGRSAAEVAPLDRLGAERHRRPRLPRPGGPAPGVPPGSPATADAARLPGGTPQARCLRARRVVAARPEQGRRPPRGLRRVPGAGGRAGGDQRQPAPGAHPAAARGAGGQVPGGRSRQRLGSSAGSSTRPRVAQAAVGTVAAASVVGLAAMAVAATGGGGSGSAAPAADHHRRLTRGGRRRHRRRRGQRRRSVGARTPWSSWSRRRRRPRRRCARRRPPSHRDDDHDARSASWTRRRRTSRSCRGGAPRPRSPADNSPVATTSPPPATTAAPPVTTAPPTATTKPPPTTTKPPPDAPPCRRPRRPRRRSSAICSCSPRAVRSSPARTRTSA